MNPRWHTFAAGHEPEEAARRELLGNIESWWLAFVARHRDISALFSRQQDWDLPAWMQGTLQAISPALMWEFGPGLESGHRLVVTPEFRHDLRPLVDEVLKRAPSIAGWSFSGHRPRESHARVLATVKARTGERLLATGIKTQRGRFNRVDVVVEFPGAALRMNRDLARSQAFVLIESTLGEEVLNTWVGEIEVGAKGWFGKGVERLPDEVGRVMREISTSLPSQPLFAGPDDAEWSLFKVEPTPDDDYPAQRDLFVGKARDAELWQNAHLDIPFYSSRYSARGEVFCYLKIDGSEGLSGEVFADKGDIEDTLDERLRGEKLGCFVGGGTGLRYSYVDLALTDVWCAMPVIRQVLRAGDLTRRSWIQFYDAEWRNEWLGIWDDSPPPPMEVRED